MRPLTLDALLAHAEGGGQILDTRTAEMFEAAHVRGAIGVGLDGRYASWCGTVLDSERELLIIADPGRESESTVRLARIGFDSVAGYLDGGMQALADRPDLLASVQRLAPSALADRLASEDPPALIDVRAESEIESGTIDAARNLPLADLGESLDGLDRDRLTVVFCSSGYRSAIAAGMLQAAGFERVGDLAGGYSAWSSGEAAAV